MWTRFMDMHSGGSTKVKPYNYIYIEAPEAEARVIFYNRFKRAPDRVTCTCCGDDYSVSESKTLEEATAFERNCDYDEKAKKYVERQKPGNMDIRRQCGTASSDKWGLYMTLEEYLASGAVLAIREKDIRPEERVGSVPKQGYVWQD